MNGSSTCLISIPDLKGDQDRVAAEKQRKIFVIVTRNWEVCTSLDTKIIFKIEQQVNI